MNKRNLTVRDTISLIVFLVWHNADDIAEDLGRRWHHNAKSWEPYGGMRHNSIAVFLDPRWDGDRPLIEVCETYDFGTPED